MFAITKEWEEVEKSKIRNKVAQFKDTKIVRVKLKTKSELRGHICKLEQETFSICNETGETVLSYAETKDIYRVGMSTGRKVAISFLVVGTIVVILLRTVPWAD